jgi:GNAT superfamily N-acetyltransferase
LHQTSLFKYASYIKEKADIELIEHEHGFTTFSIQNGHAFIHDMWVHKDHRKEGIASYFLKEIEIVAWAAGCKYVLASVQINSNGMHEALLVQFAKGFRIISANEKELNLAKEIIWVE